MPGLLNTIRHSAKDGVFRQPVFPNDSIVKAGHCLLQIRLSYGKHLGFTHHKQPCFLTFRLPYFEIDIGTRRF